MAIISVEGLRKMTGTLAQDTQAKGRATRKPASRKSKVTDLPDDLSRASALDSLPQGITAIVMDDSTPEATTKTVLTVNSILGLATGGKRLGRGLDAAPEADSTPASHDDKGGKGASKAKGKPAGKRQQRVARAHEAVTATAPEAPAPVVAVETASRMVVNQVAPVVTPAPDTAWANAPQVATYEVEEFDEVPDIAKPKVKAERKPTGGKVGPERQAFWGELIERKRNNPSKFIAIFKPQVNGRTGAPVKYSASVGSTNKRMSASGELAGFHFKCRDGYTHTKTGVVGSLIWIEQGDYTPVARASRLTAASPLARLTKPARALYDALCAAPLRKHAVDEQGNLWAAVNFSAVNIMPPSHKAKALARIKEVGLLRYVSGDMCDLQIVS